jgi:iron complex transport system ATP-binding protein
MTPYLAISHLHLTLGNKVLLDDVHLSLPLGKLVAICGLNGTGKTSLFRLLSGLENIQKGSILLGGNSIQNLSVQERSQHMALVTTERPRLQGLDVATVIELGAFGRVAPERMSDHMSHCMTMTNIAHLSQRSLLHLSDGEMQKVMMARAMAQHTRLIIADEPTAFLDYQAKSDMMELMQRLAHQENKLILFSSHDLELVKKFADIRFELANGKLKEVTTDRLI